VIPSALARPCRVHGLPTSGISGQVLANQNRG
jgi:hypothetical protein